MKWTLGVWSAFVVTNNFQRSLFSWFSNETSCAFYTFNEALWFIYVSVYSWSYTGLTPMLTQGIIEEKLEFVTFCIWNFVMFNMHLFEITFLSSRIPSYLFDHTQWMGILKWFPTICKTNKVKKHLCWGFVRAKVSCLNKISIDLGQYLQGQTSL